MTGMHDDEVLVDEGDVRRLLAAQHPQWADLTLRRLPPVGTDNQLFRLGDDLLARPVGAGRPSARSGSFESPGVLR